MRVSALKVAAAIFEAAEGVEDVTDADTAKLAACISHNNGAFRLGETRATWLVLGPVLLADSQTVRYPLIATARLRLVVRSGALLATEAVARTFRDAVRQDIGTREDGCYPEGYRKTWAPALQGEVAQGQVPMGGVSARKVGDTIGLRQDAHEYDWFDLAPLADFPVGHVVYRIKANGVLVAYQRVQPGRWLCLTATEPTCPVDLAALKLRLGFTHIEPVPDQLPVVFTRQAPNA